MNIPNNPIEAYAELEKIRHRLPEALPSNHSPRKINHLLEIADEFDAFFFDAFGVLNVGKTVIPNTVETIQALRKMNKEVLIVSNASAFDKKAMIKRFSDFGFDFSGDEIVSSRDALLANIVFNKNKKYGVINATENQSDILDYDLIWQDTPDFYAQSDEILFLSSLNWNKEKQALFLTELMKNPRPIYSGNPDLIAPQGDKTTIEAGAYTLLLPDELYSFVQIFGKPFPQIFEVAKSRLKRFNPQRTLMLGDTLHTDILGANAFGIKSALVTGHGFLKGLDVDFYTENSGIIPHFILPSI